MTKFFWVVTVLSGTLMAMEGDDKEQAPKVQHYYFNDVTQPCDANDMAKIGACITRCCKKLQEAFLGQPEDKQD